MVDFLKDILIEPFDGDWVDMALGIMMWILMIAMVVGLLWFFVWVIDSSFLPLKEKEGIVTEHYYVPAHTITSFIMVGKVMVPVTNRISASYEITIEIDGLKDNVSITYESWNETEVGDKVCCKYTNGRLCKTLYIKSFCDDNRP